MKGWRIAGGAVAVVVAVASVAGLYLAWSSGEPRHARPKEQAQPNKAGGAASPAVQAEHQDTHPSRPSPQAGWAKVGSAIEAVRSDDKDRGEIVVNEEGMVGRRFKNGVTMYPADIPMERTRPDVMSTFELMMNRRDLAERIQNSLDQDEHSECAVAANQRHPIKTDTEWVIVLHLRGDGKKMTIDHTEVDSRAWPPDFDEEAKDCYLSSFKGVSWPWTTAEALAIEYPISVGGF